jgi:hypothetical protein
MMKNPLTVAVEQALHPQTQRTETGAAILVAGSLPAPTDARPAECWVEIDVAKAHLGVAIWPTQERWRLPRDEAGLAALIAGLQPQDCPGSHGRLGSPGRRDADRGAVPDGGVQGLKFSTQLLG